jgi:NarL family two-component system response regulator LiaR
MKSKLRLLVVEDEFLVREAVCALLEQQEGITLVGQAETAATAIRLARQHQPDVILLDLHLPDQSGVELIRQLRQQVPAARILVFTGYAAAHEVAAVFRAGAAGYLLKTQMITEVVRAIEETDQGQTVIDPTVAHLILGSLTRQRQGRATMLLSTSEQRILPLVAQGCSNQEIANRLALSRATVQAHISSSLHKLRLTNRTQLVLYAFQHGWASLADVVLPPQRPVDNAP